MKIRFLVALGALGSSVALGQAVDPPQTVARIAHVGGRVSVQADGAAPSAASMNWPAIAGDRILTDVHGHAEVTLNGGTVWLEERSEVLILELSVAFARLRMERGALGVHIPDRKHTSAIRFEAAGSAIELTAPGDYRLIVTDDDRISFVVGAGVASVRTSQLRFNQLPREIARIASDGTVDISTVGAADAADDRRTRPARDRRGIRSEPHIARNLVGYEELDAHGTWRWEREYGMVWTPHSLPARWAPYRFGRWIWKAPWGWTWVDNATWGFATTHYGRWMKMDQRWSWLPGPRQIDALFAPALVGWVSDTADGELVGWFPLGPNDEYLPLYPASATHNRSLNTVTSVGVRDEFPTDPASSTADVPGAVTWTPRSAFAGHPLPTESHKQAANKPGVLNR